MQEALHGKLEDLGPDDIIRILAVSRRTGILRLSRQEGTAVLHFQDGLLVGATAPHPRPLLGELLVRLGAAGQETVDRALDVQRGESAGVPLGVILRSRFGVELRQLEPVVREQLLLTVTPLLAWDNGTYDFTAHTVMETVDAAYLDPLPLVTGSDGPAAVAEPRQTFPPPVDGTLGATVLLVDDDRDLGRCLVRGLAAEFTVVALTTAEEGLAELERLYRDGFRPTVVVDLIIPKQDGSGMLGGLDLVRAVKAGFSDLALVATTDFHHAGAADEIAAAGYPLVTKPRRGELQSELFAGFFEELRALLRRCSPSIS